MNEEACICPLVYVGLDATGSRNWNPDCPAHGTESSWWQSPEQVAQRQAHSDRLREIWAAARRARKEKPAVVTGTTRPVSVDKIEEMIAGYRSRPTQPAKTCATCRFGNEMYGRCDEMICGRFPPVWTGSEWEQPAMARSDFCGEWETK